jgi:hypothetical protein
VKGSFKVIVEGARSLLASGDLIKTEAHANALEVAGRAFDSVRHRSGDMHLEYGDAILELRSNAQTLRLTLERPLGVYEQRNTAVGIFAEHVRVRVLPLFPKMGDPLNEYIKKVRLWEFGLSPPHIFGYSSLRDTYCYAQRPNMGRFPLCAVARVGTEEWFLADWADYRCSDPGWKWRDLTLYEWMTIIFERELWHSFLRFAKLVGAGDISPGMAELPKTEIELLDGKKCLADAGHWFVFTVYGVKFEAPPGVYCVLGPQRVPKIF